MLRRFSASHQHPSISPGLLGRLWRPSVARSAWSECKTGRIATTLITRTAASWRTGRDSQNAVAVDCPAWSLCGAAGVAVRFDLHNAMPGTSRSALFLRVLLRFRVEEAPGDGSDVVEELEGGGGSCFVDCACSDEETKVGVDFFG